MSCLFLFWGSRVPVQPRVCLWPHTSAGLLIVLSLTLFVVNCETLRPRPRVSYLVTTYLCWGSGALMLWAGEGGALGRRGGSSVGQTAEPGGEFETWPPDGRGRPTWRSASRDGAGHRAGLRVQQPTYPPTRRSSELLKPCRHVEQKNRLLGLAGELSQVDVAAELPEKHVQTAVRRRPEIHPGLSQLIHTLGAPLAKPL